MGTAGTTRGCMQKVSKTRYLEVLNERLKAHPDFKAGMRFVPSPKGSEPESATGYSWEPANLFHPFVPVAEEVLKDYIT